MLVSPPPRAGRRLGRCIRRRIDAAVGAALAPFRLDFSGMELGADPDETWL